MGAGHSLHVDADWAVGQEDSGWTAPDEHAHIGVLDAAAMTFAYNPLREQADSDCEDADSASGFEQAANLVSAALTDLQSRLQSDAASSSDADADAVVKELLPIVSSGSAHLPFLPVLTPSFQHSQMHAHSARVHDDSAWQQSRAAFHVSDSLISNASSSMSSVSTQPWERILSEAVLQAAAAAASSTARSAVPSSTCDDLPDEVVAELLEVSRPDQPEQHAAAAATLAADEPLPSTEAHVIGKQGTQRSHMQGPLDSMHQAASDRHEQPSAGAPSPPSSREAAPADGSGAHHAAGSPPPAQQQADSAAPHPASRMPVQQPAQPPPSPLDVLALLPTSESTASTTALADELLDGVFREWAEGMHPPPAPGQAPAPTPHLPQDQDPDHGRPDEDPHRHWVHHHAAADAPEGGHDMQLFMGLTGPQGRNPRRPVPVAPSAEPIITDDSRQPGSPVGSPRHSWATQSPEPSPRPRAPDSPSPLAFSGFGSRDASVQADEGTSSEHERSGGLATPRLEGEVVQGPGEQQARLVATAIAAAASPEAAPAVAAASVQGFNSRQAASPSQSPRLSTEHSAATGSPPPGMRAASWVQGVLREPLEAVQVRAHGASKLLSASDGEMFSIEAWTAGRAC